jgi:hypothetical protein
MPPTPNQCQTDDQSLPNHWPTYDQTLGNQWQTDGQTMRARQEPIGGIKSGIVTTWWLFTLSRPPRPYITLNKHWAINGKPTAKQCGRGKNLLVALNRELLPHFRARLYRQFPVFVNYFSFFRNCILTINS